MHAHLNPHQDEFAELALKRIAASGAEYGDIRILDSSTQTIQGEDRRIASIQEMQDSGFGVRVLYHGAWGFAASSMLFAGRGPAGGGPGDRDRQRFRVASRLKR